MPHTTFLWPFKIGPSVEQAGEGEGEEEMLGGVFSSPGETNLYLSFVHLNHAKGAFSLHPRGVVLAVGPSNPCQWGVSVNDSTESADQTNLDQHREFRQQRGRLV